VQAWPALLGACLASSPAGAQCSFPPRIPPPPRAPGQPPPPPISTYDPFILFFESGSAALTPQILTLLDNAVAGYRESPVQRLEIAGNADRVGASEDNLRLSQRRAEAVAGYLRPRLPGLPIGAYGCGESLPLRPTPDEVPEPQNRNAIIHFYMSPPGGGTERR
jgi:outer membrane protein OmpA-like peptidoglycan-associated protein